MTTDIGSNLRAIRGRVGLSQEELSKRADVREATISGIENGQVVRPQAGTIYRLAKALGVTVADLFATTVSETPPSGSS